MHIINQNKLHNKYPDMFSVNNPYNNDLNEMTFIHVGDGWYKIIDTLCFKLTLTIGAEGIQVMQVKEKFGALRFYVMFNNISSEDMQKANDLIDEAELKSINTCEICGAEGKRSTVNGYMVTRCNKCIHENY